MAPRKRRLCWLGLAAGIAVTTVAVPALIFPRGGQRTSPTRAASSSTAALSPSPGGSAAPATVAAPPDSPASPAACAGRATAKDGQVYADRPSCRAYQGTLGAGWQVAAVDATALPGERVPGSDRIALRVEPQQRSASVALVAAVPVAAPGRLLASVYGGRVRGTSLRVSASGSAQADPSRSVVLTAQPDRWTTFNVDLTALLPAGRPAIRRIDFGLAYDATPNTGRFFLDDIELID
jgi:hypothetical protein